MSESSLTGWKPLTTQSIISAHEQCRRSFSQWHTGGVFHADTPALELQQNAPAQGPDPV